MHTLPLKGDYFNGAFHLEQKHPLEIIKKSSPADLDNILWECFVQKIHIDPVIQSATEGFNLWKKISLDERIQYLRKYQELLLAKKDLLAQSIALETGKPLWEAMTEVQATINKVKVTIEDSLPRIAAKKISHALPHLQGDIIYMPLGVCLVIGPFNFPSHLPNGQIVSALLAGNSIIFKPSEKTIHSGQLLIECFHEAGFPSGVVNFINGGGSLVSEMLNERCIKGVFFTGSKEVGIKIAERTHKDLTKLVALELGGKNTTIIHDDASLDYTLLELLRSCFLSSGQRCTATSKVAIHKKIAQQFVEKFHQLAKKIIIDHPIEHAVEPFMGPLIDEKSRDNYLLYMGMAKREGYQEIMRGKTLERKHQGYYVSPSLHFKEKAEIQSLFLASEIFGPSCTFIPYEDMEEAIHIANMGEYGLVSSIFTAQKSIYQKCLQEVNCGLINWNRSTVGASPHLPFGGVKFSGNYRAASSFMIDSCVYPLSSLTTEDEPSADWSSVKGMSQD